MLKGSLKSEIESGVEVPPKDGAPRKAAVKVLAPRLVCSKNGPWLPVIKRVLSAGKHLPSLSKVLANLKVNHRVPRCLAICYTLLIRVVGNALRAKEMGGSIHFPAVPCFIPGVEEEPVLRKKGRILADAEV